MLFRSLVGFVVIIGVPLCLQVQPDLICLDPRMLGKVDTEAMQTRVEANSKKLVSSVKEG